MADDRAPSTLEALLSKLVPGAKEFTVRKRAQYLEELSKAVASLAKRRQHVVRLRNGLTKSRTSRSIEEVSTLLRIPPDRVREIENAAYIRLRRRIHLLCMYTQIPVLNQ